MSEASDKAAADKLAADRVAAEKLAADHRDADAKKAAADKAEADTANTVASNTAAEAALKAAEEEAKKHPKPAFDFSGSVGGPFSISGDNLGTEGKVHIGDREVATSRWHNTSIKGVVPADLKAGPVIVTVNGKKAAGKI